MLNEELQPTPPKTKHLTFDTVKLFLDAGIILIAGLSLWTNYLSTRRADEAISSAREANRIAQLSFNAAHVPWLQLHDISVKPENNHDLKFSFVIKNYAQSPALDVKVDVSFGEGVKTSSIDEGPAIMPQDSQVAWTTLGVVTDNRQFLKKIQSGPTQIPILFQLNYKDVLNKTHSAEIRYLWDKDGFLREGYRVIS